jgi:NADH dehydrogenase [ubiquinone] 1 alpha subcomplex assembly factor 1
MTDMRAVRFALLLAVTVTLMTSCTSESMPVAEPATTITSTSSTTANTITGTPLGDNIVVSFPDPASVAAWNNVDDSVMGGVSASTSTWQDKALVFTGTLSTDNNGGFASILGPVDRTIRERSTGATSLVINAVGDGRTYLLQLRAGTSGNDRWISRFTPQLLGDDVLSPVVMPISSFEPVDRFLRPTNTSQPLDPATIIQIGVYVLDGQVGEFQLTLRSISSMR